MTWDQAVNLVIMLAGLGSLVVPMHLDNRRKAAMQAERLARQGQVLDEVLMTIQRHDKRTRKTRQLTSQVIQRIDRLEMAIDLQSYQRNPPP